MRLTCQLHIYIPGGFMNMNAMAMNANAGASSSQQTILFCYALIALALVLGMPTAVFAAEGYSPQRRMERFGPPDIKEKRRQAVKRKREQEGGVQLRNFRRRHCARELFPSANKESSRLEQNTSFKKDASTIPVYASFVGEKREIGSCNLENNTCHFLDKSKSDESFAKTTYTFTLIFEGQRVVFLEDCTTKEYICTLIFCRDRSGKCFAVAKDMRY